MSKRLFGSLAMLLVLAFLRFPGLVATNGPKSGPAVYVSTADGKQILVADGEMSYGGLATIKPLRLKAKEFPQVIWVATSALTGLSRPQDTWRRFV